MLGPDGALWFTERGANRVGRIDISAASPGTANGITEYPLATGRTSPLQPVDLTVGSDGAVWVTLSAGGIARVDTSAVAPGTANGITSSNLPTSTGQPQGIVLGTRWQAVGGGVWGELGCDGQSGLGLAWNLEWDQ